MISKLRLKFIIITGGALIILLISILVSTNIVMKNNNDRQTNDILIDLVNGDGRPPRGPDKLGRPKNPEDIIEVFAVTIDKNNEIIEIVNEQSSISDDEIKLYLDEVMASEKQTGQVDNIHYLVQEKDYGKVVAFVNQSVQNIMLEQLRSVSYIIGISSIIILLIIVFFLSKLVTKPVEQAFEKQKRFVSDSGHELKTPLSILSANTEMLKMEIGDNNWLVEIQKQSHRMNKLIHELLTLAKTDDMNSTIQFFEFDLSSTVTSTVLPFEVLAFEDKKQIECDIEEDIRFKGNEKQIREMLEALMDNAVKYSDSNSTISVSLYQKGSKKYIEIKNMGIGIDEANKQHIFEKFYRIDVSRARETGGYGLGLSIVKNIVDIHKGKIDVDIYGGFITFRVVL